MTVIQSRSVCKLFPRSRERTGCVNTAQSVESVTDHILKLTQHQPPLSHCASWLQKAFSRTFEKKGYIMIRMAISSSYFQRAKKCQVVNLRRWKEKWLFCYSDTVEPVLAITWQKRPPENCGHTISVPSIRGFKCTECVLENVTTWEMRIADTDGRPKASISTCQKRPHASNCSEKHFFDCLTLLRRH